ncbi:MAG: hypothetical protein KAU41_00080 [Deltaproteobacteria bacterium]|nr:hypothetical protein [Deltaproteobacteria bacterium]
MTVVALTDGEAVVPTLQKAAEKGKLFDLCICDVQMPGMSGHEVAKKNQKFKIQNSKHSSFCSIFFNGAGF